MTVVTLARQYGAGGRAVGHLLAEKLGYQFVDQILLDHLAREAGVAVRPTRELSAAKTGDFDAPKQKSPLKLSLKELENMSGEKLLAKLAGLVTSSPFIRHTPGVSPDFDEGKYRLFLRRTIVEIANHGHAVIVGRGGQLLLKRHPEAIRIYLVGEKEDRVKNLMNRYGLDRAKAETLVKSEEKKRIFYLQGFDAGDSEDILLYHLIINTSHVSSELAVDFIYNLTKARENEKSDAGRSK